MHPNDFVKRLETAIQRSVSLLAYLFGKRAAHEESEFIQRPEFHIDASEGPGTIEIFEDGAVLWIPNAAADALGQLHTSGPSGGGTNQIYSRPASTPKTCPRCHGRGKV